MSDELLNGFRVQKPAFPRASEVFTMQQPGSTGAKASGESVSANPGSTSASMRAKGAQPYRPPGARSGKQAAAPAHASVAANPTSAKMSGSTAAHGQAMTSFEQGSTGRGYSHGNPGDAKKSYSHSTWHPTWLEDTEQTFKIAKFRFNRNGPGSPVFQVCQSYAMRQSMIHTTESCVRYQLSTAGGNIEKIKFGRSVHFPNVVARDEENRREFINPLYNDLMDKYKVMVKYGDIVPNSIKIYSSGMVVPQEVKISTCSIIGGSKTDVCGISITGLSDVFHVKKCYDAGKTDKMYNAIVTSHSPVEKTVYQYYPMDHVAHYETMYGPVDKETFPKSFKGNLSAGVVPLEVTSPVFLFMLCNIGTLFTSYMEKLNKENANPSEWENIIDENLTRFYRSTKNVPNFNDADSDLDEEMLTAIVENIFDQRPSRVTKVFPPWTFNLEGEEHLFYIPQKFRDVLEAEYFDVERHDTFDRNSFDIVASDLNASGESNTTVNLILDVAAFTPICFSYIRNVPLAP